MRIEMTIELDGREPVEVVADARDLRAWEMWGRSQRPPYPARPGGTDDTDFPMTVWMTRLSFTAAVRDGVWSGTWDEWLDAVTGIESEEDEEPEGPDPTQLAPTSD